MTLAARLITRDGITYIENGCGHKVATPFEVAWLGVTGESGTLSRVEMPWGVLWEMGGTWADDPARLRAAAEALLGRAKILERSEGNGKS